MNLIRTDVRAALKQSAIKRRGRSCIAILSIIAAADVSHVTLAADAVDPMTAHVHSPGTQGDSTAQAAGERRAPTTKGTAPSSKAKLPTLEEVVVTGSHISGRPPQSQPMIVFTREQIEDSGYPTLQEFMTSIPQNLGAVGSGTIGLTDNGLASDVGFGTGVDLRGLGYESTLVLVNGHRLAPAGTEGAFTDVSVLPLAAIQRIDVLTAGASAIYGSDAVGGVVNYVLRDQLAGAETSVNYGGVTEGGLRDVRVSQSLGATWGGGGGFVSYEYHDETPLPASDREFSRSSIAIDLLPESRQHSVFGTIHQSVNDRLRLSGDLLYTDRHNHASFAERAAPLVLTDEAETTQYDASLGAELTTGGTWVIDARIGAGGNVTQSQGADYFLRARSDSLSAEITANGTLLTIPTGAVQGAMGTQVREQRLSQRFGGADARVPAIDKSRSVSSLFAEARVPLLGPAETAGGTTDPRLELDVAGRLEHYTDFGSSVNPDVGLAWRALRPLRVRATWGSSFAAPQLWELVGPQYTYLLNSLTQSPPGKSAVLLRAGTNSGLRAERSSQWTAGLDLTPPDVPELEFALTYYSIHYRDRITTPNIPFASALESGPTYSPFIEFNPTSAEVSRLASPPYTFYDETTIPFYGPPRSLSDVVAVVDNRIRNIGTTDTDGVDLTSSYGSRAFGYSYRLSANGTYVLHFRDTPRPGASPISLLSTLNNPINFRARVMAQVSKGRMTASATTNYYNSYVDNTIFTSPKRIASWTTIDLGVRFRIWSHDESEFRPQSLDAFLSCTNCGDRPPPFVSSDIYARGYDPANANALGRYVSVALDARW